MIPSHYDPKDFLTMTMFYMDYASFNFPPESHRNGTIVVEDATGLGLKHVDTRLFKVIKEAGIEGNSGMQDLIPGKLKGILILNPPLIIKALFKLARLFMKKKLIQRVQIVTPADIMRDWVSPDNLHTVFGGSLEYNHQKWVAEEIEKEMHEETKKMQTETDAGRHDG
eukprot:TRINITY_DN2605_c0_g1_i1.p1 TRINITY_DN2605_c0_g1~~TRINITY_DN2605_c0_g1_i1.p1  ORF type:complete len:168 (-),score=33.24 TRINITY_DN2605_c0_g1_i1:108-611(-)